MEVDNVAYPEKFARLDRGNNHRFGGGGGGDMESRVAKLESDVSDIKTNVALLVSKIDNMAESISKLPTAEAVNCKFELVENKFDLVGIKLADLNEKVSKKASEDQVKLESSKIDTKIGGIKIWFLTLLLFSISMPIITLLINLYLKK